MTQEAGTPPGFWERVEQIAERAVAKYARSGALRNASISGGNGLTIRDGGRFSVRYPQDLGGGMAVYVGDIVADDGVTYQGTGLLVEDASGKDVATFRTSAATGGSVVILRDRDERTVVNTDSLFGGLSRPYVSQPLYANRYQDMTVSSVSGTFETVFGGGFYKNHAGLSVTIRATMDTAGTTGELRVLVNGQQLGPVATLGFSVNTYGFFGNVPGEIDDWIAVEVQARRTSATGAVRTVPVSMYSRAGF